MILTIPVSLYLVLTVSLSNSVSPTSSSVQTIKMKNDARKALIAAGRELPDEDDDDTHGGGDNDSLSQHSQQNQQKTKPNLHTKLTTEKGLQLYRSILLNLLTVYVKVMPGHDVLRLVLDSNDTVWHLHNMFKTHHHLGSRQGSMLILPTVVGMFHMNADMIPENEYLTACRTALIPIKNYHMTRRNSAIVTIYVPYYKDDTLVPIMRKYIQENLIPTNGVGGGNGMTMSDMNNLPNLIHNKTIPEYLESDVIQQSLLPVVMRNYQDQQIHTKARYQIMGKRHREQVLKLADERQKQQIVRFSFPSPLAVSVSLSDTLSISPRPG
jgi:hypothetical protein